MSIAASRAKSWILIALVAATAVAGADAVATEPSSPPVVEGFIDAGDGVQLRYRRLGDSAEPVIVLHGGPGLSMDYLASDLSALARSRSVVFYDQRGAGRSTLVSDPAALDAQRFADDLEAVRRHFGLERLTLIGHSWGAGVAALYAMRHPERVSRIVLVGPMPLRRSEFDRSFAVIAASRPPEEAQQIRAAAAAVRADAGSAEKCRAFYVLWFRPFFADPAVMSRTRGDFCAGSPEALRNGGLVVGRHTAPSLGDFDWRQPLQRVSAPVLVVHGRQEVIPLSAAEEWAEALPEGRLLRVEGAGHFPYVEAPDAFFPAIDAFLGGQWPSGAQRPGS